MSREVERRVLDAPDIEAGACVFVFRSFGSEVSTLGLIERLAERGCPVCLPVIEAGALAAAGYRRGDPLVTAWYGAMEPRLREIVDPAGVDVVVVPGLAFDREGFRLGYGAGYYDRYLRRVRPLVPRLAIGFHQQVVDHVPHGPNDERVDAVITDLETIRVTRRPAR